MSINLIFSPPDTALAAIVRAALVRSFSDLSVQVLGGDPVEAAGGCYLFLNPQDDRCPLVQKLLTEKVKIAVFGRMGVALGKLLGISVEDYSDRAGLSEVLAAPAAGWDQSSAAIHYGSAALLPDWLKAKARPLLRYDFTDEWNNLGFGAIAATGIWSIAQAATLSFAQPLAELRGKAAQTLTAYAALTTFETAEVLWINREVGPVDSWEWSLIETFFSHYRAADLPCVPHLKEVPAGYQGGVTMRLDCDQAIATARPLFELYAEAGLPFSLAVVTGLPPQVDDRALLRDVIAAGGAVVSHSVSHPPNWGPDYAAALAEAQSSKQWLETHLPEAQPVHYAVSPFHQNPPYAVQALAAAGYAGFVGGIIHNDPEYLLGRAGQVPFCPTPLISHSQQCMLHGDCYHRYGNSVAPYCQSFSQHLEAGSLFGYLDHPFSATYQYGWHSEAERLAAHAELIGFIQARDRIWYPNLAQCLDFVRKRSQIQVGVDAAGQLRVGCDRPSLPAHLPSVAVGWRGQTIDLKI